MARPRKNPDRPMTVAERQAEFRRRREVERDREFSELQSVVSEAALLCRDLGLPYESVETLRNSLIAYRQELGRKRS